MNSTPALQRLAHALVGTQGARIAWRLLLALLVVAVLYLALTPMPPAQMDLGWDKLNHLVAFASLALSACMAFNGQRRAVVFALLTLLAFGGLIEVLQGLVPSRSSDWADLAADAIGIVCGALPALYALRMARVRPIA